MDIPNFTIAVAIAIGLAMSSAVYANNHHPNADAKSAGAIASEVGLSEGEVRKVDKDTGKVTIKHGPLVNLGMPAMTMVFQVKDPAMLDQVKAGDKINFIAEKVGGQYTVTRVEAVK
jgi:Cu(I)/Ag(I) efflux system protein CusF